MSSKHVIITAGGQGTRMGSSVPKQFLKLEGLPVIFRSMQAFFDYDPKMHFIIVLPEGTDQEWNNLCREHGLIIPYNLCKGGDTRFQSVKNGLELVPDEGLVAIHDAVRPLVSTKLISRCFTLAEKNGNAVPVIPLTDSIRELNEMENRPADRNRFRLVQTPQVFESRLIKNAYEQAYRFSFTDDASVAEAFGAKIFLMEGEKKNIKITTLDDMYIASALLRN